MTNSKRKKPTPPPTPPPPPVTSKPRFWFWMAGILGAIAGVIAIAMLARGTTVRDYVDNTYTRAANLDRGEEIAFTSPQAPTLVAANIVGKWKPVSQYADASGVYLRYNDDMVLVRPQGKGSVIRVDDVERAYRTYHSSVGGNWGWTSGHGESFRGRGPGAGK
ncbi:protein of unknown function [Actinokineospora alba]|uniref:DUF4247 domain-containing protein n=1 Tax=Actinokineospora alba TaxID=504798 RepID=A0A1H0SRU4_9PSEU|nr:DUF4247 domain-containing protein [Actinokineospora alba]TDP66567.1 uncharacterized protein DUF4247 [Actinokineospora alba]SDJ37925.1 protein of unknown function [Actinokineospora alba]SDP44481.1 protein of unknown function [Actinokineospora alba]